MRASSLSFVLSFGLEDGGGEAAGRSFFFFFSSGRHKGYKTPINKIELTWILVELGNWRI